MKEIINSIRIGICEHLLHWAVKVAPANEDGVLLVEHIQAYLIAARAKILSRK